MLNFLAALPSSVLIALRVVGFVLLTYLLMILIHRAIPYAVRHEHNDVVGFIIAVVAVFYGLIIASVLVIAINRFDHAQQVVENEANLVGDIVRIARAMSPQLEGPVKQLAARYLDDVITKEWPAQKHGQRTVLLAVSLALIFALIAIFDRSFQGEVAASDEPYRLIRGQVAAN